MNRLDAAWTRRAQPHAPEHEPPARSLRWLEFLEGARFESSRQNLPEMRTFLARYFSDTANASASVIR